MDTIISRKKTGIFTAALFILIQAVKITVQHFTMVDGLLDGDALTKAQMISRLGSIGINVITLILVVGAGYLLTKDKKKTVMYVGSVYFGMNVTALFTKLVTEISRSLYSLTVRPYIVSTAVGIINYLLVAVSIFTAYFAFTAMEGINSKFPSQSADTSVMTVSRARKRYLAAYVISSVIVAAFSTIPAFIFSVLDADGMTTAGSTFSVVSSVMSWLSVVTGFAIMYYAGYKPAKSHVEAITFCSAIALQQPVTSILAGALSIILTAISASYNPGIVAGAAGNAYTYSMMSTIGNGVIFNIGFVVEIALCMYALKLFFTKKAEAPVLYEAATDTEASVAEEE